MSGGLFLTYCTLDGCGYFRIGNWGPYASSPKSAFMSDEYS